MNFFKKAKAWFDTNASEDDTEEDAQPEEELTPALPARGPVIERHVVTPTQAERSQPVAQPVSSALAINQNRSVPSLEKMNGELSLVRYSPEELLQQVHQENDHVEFGQSRITRTMDVYGELWSLIGPVVLLVGTIGEVFLVLWTRQKSQQIWTALSILAVAMVLEGTFLAVSYKTATIRNRADKRPGGHTEGDKRKLRTQLVFWILLSIGVCFTQIVFIVAQTKADGLDQTAIILFAIARSFFTLIADGYTAFAHEEMPTTGERKLEEKEQRAKHTSLSLDQKIDEINIINKSQLALLQAHSEAQIAHEKLQTRLESERLQNKALIEAMVAQQAASTMFAQTGSGMIRALFDVNMPDEQRAKMLSTMSGFMGAVKQLPDPDTGRKEGKLLPESVEADTLSDTNPSGALKITVDAVRLNPHSFHPKNSVRIAEVFSQNVRLEDEKSGSEFLEKGAEKGAVFAPETAGKRATFASESFAFEDATFAQKFAQKSDAHLPNTGALSKLPTTDPALQTVKDQKITRKLSLDDLDFDQKEGEKVASSKIPPKQASIRPRYARVSNTRLAKNLYTNGEAAKAAKCAVSDIEKALESGELLTAKNSDKILKSSLEKFIQEMREKREEKWSLVK